MDYLKTFVLLAIFLLMAVSTIISNFRHHNERKAAKKAGTYKRKRQISLPFSKRKASAGAAAPVAGELDEAADDDLAATVDDEAAADDSEPDEVAADDSEPVAEVLSEAPEGGDLDIN